MFMDSHRAASFEKLFNANGRVKLPLEAGPLRLRTAERESLKQ